MDTGARTSSKNAGDAVPTPIEFPAPRTVRTVPPVPTLNVVRTVETPVTKEFVTPIPPIT